MDHVDEILKQWAQERPELDTQSMALIGRLKRLMTHLNREMGKTWSAHGLSSAGFDVLATLLRAGSPYRLSPGDLLDMTMVTSGTMTARIDQLETAGHVERIKNPRDARSVLIGLTRQGRQVIDRAVTDHTETQARLTSELTKTEFQQLNKLTKVFLSKFESKV